MNQLLPPKMIWLDAEGVATMLTYSVRQVRERIACRPGFPVPVRLDGHPRWNAAEVNQWFERHREAEKVVETKVIGDPVITPRQLMTAHPLHNTWKKMWDRCTNANADNFKWYGGRGVDVCARWRDFWAFVNDMGPRPTPEHTIDRRDNDRGYGPENCRWATTKEQYANRRCARCDHG